MPRPQSSHVLQTIDELIETDAGVVVHCDDDPDGKLLAIRIARAMAEVTGRAPEEIEPLCSTLDTDALADLFFEPRPGDERAHVTLKFVHDGCEILLTENHRIAVQVLDTSDSQD